MHKPRNCDLSIKLCSVGGIADPIDMRAATGYFAECLSAVEMVTCTIEDTFSGARLVDSARGKFEGCLLQRNGCAISLAECTAVTITGCRFADQRVSNLCTLEPPGKVGQLQFPPCFHDQPNVFLTKNPIPQQVTVHAIHGGKT